MKALTVDDIEILHDLKYQNNWNHGSIVYTEMYIYIYTEIYIYIYINYSNKQICIRMGSCKIYIIKSNSLLTLLLCLSDPFLGGLCSVLPVLWFSGCC